MTKNFIKIVVLAICLLFVSVNFSAAGVITYKTSDGTVVNVEDTQNKDVDLTKCTPLAQRLEKARKHCMFCPLFKILYTAGASVSVASFDALAAPFQTLLVIGLALYIGFLTLKQVGAFTKQDGSKYISELLIIGFKVFIAFLLLGNGSQIYKLGLEPLISAGLEVGASFLSAPSAENSVDITSCGQGTVSGTDKAFYSDALQEKLDCYLRKVGEETMVGDVVGSTLVCFATSSSGAMPIIRTLVSGLFIRLFALLIYVAFAFYLIDAVVRLGIVGAILPFLIASWPFKVTSGYTKKGWDIYLNAVFIFIFMGLIVNVTIELLSSSVTGGNGDSSEILGYMADDNIVKLIDLFEMGGASFLFVILCGIFGFKLCGEASSLAAEMGTSGGTSIASKIGGLGANAAYGVAKKGVKAGAKGAVAVTKGVASVIPTGGGKSLRTRVNNGLDKISQFRGNVAQKLHDKLTPEGRLAAKNAKNSQPVPTSNNDGKPQPNNEGNNIPDPNTGGSGNGGPKPNDGNGGPNPNIVGGGGNNPNTTNDAIPLGDGGPAPTGDSGDRKQGQDTETTSQDETEAIKAEEAKGNRDNESSVLTGNSQGNQQNLEEIARKAAEDAASKLNNNQQGADSVESDPARGQLQEGEIYAKNGELKADLNRDAKGNLVQTIYKAGNNGESKQPAMIVTEDKSGNREWMRFGDNGQVVEQGNSVVETGKLGKFVAMERTIRDNVETVKYFYPNGNLKSEILQSVNKDGTTGDTLRFRQFSEDGKMTLNTGAHGMNKQNRASGQASAETKAQGQPTATTQQTGQPTATGPQPGQPTATTQQTGQPTATNPQATQPTGQPTATTQQTGQPTATTQQTGQPTATGSQPGQPTAATQQTGQPTKPAPQGASVPLPKESLANIAKSLAQNPLDKDGKKIADTKDANGNAIKVSYAKDGQVNGVTRTSNVNGVKSEEYVKLNAKKNVVESGKTIDYRQGDKAFKIEQVVKDGVATIKMSQYDPKLGPSSMKPVAELTGKADKDGKLYGSAKLKTFDDKGNLLNNKKVDAKAAEARIMASVPQAKPADDKANGKPQTQQQKEQEKTAQKADDKTKGQPTATSPQTGQPTATTKQTGQPTQPAPQGASVPSHKDSLDNIAKLLAKNPLDKDGKKIAGLTDDKGNAIKVSYGKDGQVNGVVRTSNVNGVKSEEFVKLDAKKNVVESGKTIDYRKGDKAIKIEQAVKDGVATIKMSQYDPKVGLSSMKPVAELTGKVDKDGKLYGSAKLKTFDDKGNLVNNKKVDAKAAEAKIMASVPQAKPADDKTKGQPQTPQKENGKPAQKAGDKTDAPATPKGEQPKKQPDKGSETSTPDTASSKPVTQGKPSPKPQQSEQQTSNEQAQPAPVEAPKPKPVAVDRLREGVVRDDEGHMLSETVKHADGDTNKTTRVLYSPEGKIYNIAEEDEKGNREWYSFGSEGNISAKPTEHGTRTINDDGSVNYTLYDDNNKVISQTVENADGSSVQSFCNDNGEAYAKVEKDASGKVTCSMIGDEESSQTTLKPEEGASGGSLKAESGADGELKAEPGSKIGDKVNITFDFSDKKDNGNEHDAAVRQRELETLVRDLKRTISGLGNNSESGSSLSSVALDALMGELKRRGIKVGG